MKNKLKLFICFSVLYAIISSCFFQLSVSALQTDIILPSGLTSKECNGKITEYINENSSTDAAVCAAVVCKDQTVSEIISGYQDIDKGYKADQSTVYEWGSLTKVLTWIGIMQLEEQGKLDLNENIEKFLPENFLKKLTYNTPVTMLDLMNHTGGWQDSITDVYTDNADDVVSLEEYVSEHEPPQIYEPGTTVAYSNWGVTLAGLIIENLSGSSYIDYINTNIFEPLKMNNTSVDPLREDNAFVKENIKKVKGYTTAGKEIKGRYYAPDYPAAGAAGTLDDAEKLMKALLSDSTPLFKNQDTLKKMLTSTNNYLYTDYPETSHGLWFDSYMTETMGHSGNTAQFSTHMSLDPVSGTGVLVMVNQAQEMTFTTGIGNLVFGKINPENTDDDQWQTHSFKNNYVCARTIEKGYCHIYNYFQIYKVKITNQNEIMIYSPIMKLPCKRIADDIYIVSSGILEGYKIYTDADENGVVRRMAIYTFDFNGYSDMKYIIDTVVFVAFVIAFILALIAVIFSIREYLRKKEKIVLLRTGMNILTILFFVVMFAEIIKLSATTASTNDMIPFLAFDAVYILADVLYTVVSILKKQKSIISCITIFSSFCITCFILYWKMLILM